MHTLFAQPSGAAIAAASGSAAAPAAPQRWTVPAPDERGAFATDALLTAFGYKRGKNVPWKCPVPQCGGTGQGTTRLRQHSETHVASIQGYKQFHEAQFAPSLVSASAKPASTSAAASEGQQTIVSMLGNKRQCAESINRAIGRFCVARGEAAYIVEEPAFLEMIQTCMDAARRSNVSASELVYGRTAMTRVADQVARDEYAQLREALIPEKDLKAHMVAITLSSDGRMSVRKQPLMVFNAEVVGGFLPLGAIDPGASSKSAKYIKDLVGRYLDDGDLGEGLGKYIFAVVMDGASANISAMRLLRQQYSLLTVRCQSHALSLFASHLMNGPLDELRKRIDALMGLFCNNNRAFKLFDEASKGATLIRPCTTRFATYFYAAHSLFKHADAIKGVLVSSKFNDWVKVDATAKAKKTWRLIEDVVFKPEFWADVKDCRDLLAAVVQALRLVDQTRISPSAVYTVWRKLGELIIDRMEASSLAVEKRADIYKLYLEDLEKAECDVLVAAHVLDPNNHSEMRALASERTDEYVLLRVITLRALDAVRTRRIAATGVEFSADKLSRELDAFFATNARSFDPKEDTFESWYMQFGKIGVLACIILCVKVTISDVERVNKVYAYVQTPERNRLLLSRVNNLVKGRLAIKAAQRGEIVEDKGIVEFVTDVDQLVVDTQGWLQSLKRADQALKVMDEAELVIPEPTSDVVDLVELPLDDVGGAEGSTKMGNTDVADQANYIPARRVVPSNRRSSRRVVVPARFKQAQVLYGLRDYDLEEPRVDATADDAEDEPEELEEPEEPEESEKDSGEDI